MTTSPRRHRCAFCFALQRLAHPQVGLPADAQAGAILAHFDVSPE